MFNLISSYSALILILAVRLLLPVGILLTLGKLYEKYNKKAVM